VSTSELIASWTQEVGLTSVAPAEEGCALEGSHVRLAHVDGRTVAYERAGTGRPLVLLHGGLSDHREWRRQIDGLSDAFDVIAWDTPGTGGSASTAASMRMPGYADILAGFIDALHLERPHLLGLSWGSALAIEFFRRHRDIAASLVLTAAYAGWAGSLPPETVRQRLATSLRDMEELPPEAFVRTWVPSLFTDVATSDVIEGYVNVMASFRREGVRTMLHAIAEADLRDVLPTIDVPTLLLYGERDARSPVHVARAMHAAIPTSELVVLPDVGHMSNLESPDAFNDAVRSFLERVDRER
jgi:pimeloyl-ACP methyl ester carboxylesterase